MSSFCKTRLDLKSRVVYSNHAGQGPDCHVFLFVNLQYSAKILDLARKQRMNTDIRRNIFCVVMSSEDYLDAFEKLLRFV